MSKTKLFRFGTTASTIHGLNPSLHKASEQKFKFQQFKN